MKLPDFGRVAKLFNGLKGALAAVALIVFVPIVTFSESALRQAVTGWLDGCLIVVAKDVYEESPTRVSVRLHTSGALPKDLAMNFRANEGLIHEVRYFSTVDPSGRSPYTSLFLHHLHGQTCPGALCEGIVGSGDGERRRSIELSELTMESDQGFNVEFGQTVSPDALSVFVMQRKGKSSSCRVQNENAFNWFFRQGKWVKFLVTLILLGLMLVVVKQLKSVK